tara:strand:- start:1150 stop:1467 length:318 start_codon:yes stop_codon:yes gene_type:complete
MDKNRLLAHVGLALVAILPLPLYLVLVLLGPSDSDKAEVFTSGVPAFLGFFATAMTILGWILVIPALIISIRGLIKGNNLRINAATLLLCLGWLMTGYWIMTHFA